MSHSIRSHEVHVPAWIAASKLQVHADGFIRHLLAQGYSRETVFAYRAAVAHFAHWITVRKIALRQLDERVITRFCTQHLPVCRCGPLRQRTPYTVRAALRALLRFLRSVGSVGSERSMDPPAITRELQTFAHYQERVCGLTQSTREVSRLRVRAFLLGSFGRRRIRMNALSAQDVMRFLTRYTANCTARSRCTISRSIRKRPVCTAYICRSGSVSV